MPCEQFFNSFILKIYMGVGNWKRAKTAVLDVFYCHFIVLDVFYCAIKVKTYLIVLTIEVEDAYSSVFRYESNGIFVLGVGFFFF